MKTLFIAVILFSTSTWSNENTPTDNIAPKVAISLSYDDALNSQLDNAAPALNLRGLKASFYVVPSSPVFSSRLNEWRALALQGHELGNHSLFHWCRSDKEGREWVTPSAALESKSVVHMVSEITVASTLLQAVDGQTIRTFTPPCFDQMAKDGNYVEAIKPLFIGIKSTEDKNTTVLLAPRDMTAQQIIGFVEKQPKNITLINILFHGVGSDHLAVTTQEHAGFLDYLVANQHKYRVDTYRNLLLDKNEY